MKQLLESEKVIDSLQSIVINLEKRRLNSNDAAERHLHIKQYSFKHFFTGQSNGFFESIDVLKKYLDRLIIEN